MTITEYKSQQNPNKTIALIVSVNKHAGKPFYEYISLIGLNQRQIQEAKIYAEKIHQYHIEDRKQQLRAKLINTQSKTALSNVIGISMCIANKPLKNGGITHEFRISIASADGLNFVNDDATTPSKAFEIVCRLTDFDYPWFVQAWHRACRIRARAIGLKRTPTQWLRAVASENAVEQFIRKQVRQNLKKIKQG